jgi:oxazoline/thiazoline synthase
MLNFPAWSAAFRIEVLSADQVVLLDEQNCKVLSGRVFPLLVDHMDGRRSVREIAELLQDRVIAPEIMYALDLGEHHQFIVDGPQESPKLATFWNAAGIPMGSLNRHLNEETVQVDSLSAVPAEGLRAAIRHLGVKTAEKGRLRVVVTDDYLDPVLHEVNEAALEEGLPWLLCRPRGNAFWIGPLFVPGETGCWECLATRLRGNRLIEDFIERRTGNGSSVRAPLSELPSAVAAAENIAATEIARALALGSRSPIAGSLLAFDCVSLETRRHVLTRRPQCQACGVEPPRSEPKPIVFAPAGGQGQPTTALATFKRLEKHISPLTGVVRTLEPMDDGSANGLTYSYAAGHNFALMDMDVQFVLDNIRCRSGGKGVTDAQAKASAIAEAIERYSGVYRGDEPERLASFNDLKSQGAIHPNELMLFSERQFADRASWNLAQLSNFHFVPEPFDPNRPVKWVMIQSLTSGPSAWAPSAYCYYGHPDLAEWFFCTSDSNGNAAGNSIEEAVFQGLMELVERDAVAIHWYNRLQRPAVDLDSVDDPYVRLLRSLYDSLGRSLWVLDVTSDIGIPVFAAVSSRRDGPSSDILVGFGAHPAPHQALMRALTEVNQFLPAVARRDASGHTLYAFKEPEAINWWKSATLESEAYLTPNPTMASRPLSEMAEHSSGDVGLDLTRCLDILKRHGTQVYALNQTQSDIELHVVKVMAPGLRHFWKRFGGGRLYDVPVKLGWIDRPRAETALNPRGVFF